MPPDAKILEIASGSGEHAVFIARAMPRILWQPSDPDERARRSIAAWIAHEALGNVLPPRDVDVRRQDWGTGLGAFNALVAINMIHYAPWNATASLFAGARKSLGHGGLVFLYGPFRRDGKHTAPSNEVFEAWLKERDPAFGVRDLGEVESEAGRCAFSLWKVIEMPANNLSLVFTA